VRKSYGDFQGDLAFFNQLAGGDPSYLNLANQALSYFSDGV